MADERIEIIIGARDDFSKTFKSFRKASLAASAVFTTLGVLSAKAAIDFETGFTGVRKTVDATEKELAGLEQEFRKLLRATPIATREILAVGEAAGQLGIKTKDIAAFTKVMLDLGVTTNITAQDAATSLARLANITGLSADEFENLGSVIVGLGNSMETTEAEILAMTTRISSASTVAGLTEAEMVALAATLSSVGLQAELGGTAVSRLLLEMNSAVTAGDKVGKLFATIAGQTMPAFQKSFEEDGAGALATFFKGLKKAKDRGQDLNPIIEALGFNGTRMKDVFIRLTNANEKLSGSFEKSEKLFRENNALAKEANLFYGTTASQLTMAKNRLDELAESYGKVLLPVLVEFLDASDKVVEFLRESTPEFKIMAVQLGLIATLVGPVAIGINLIGKALMASNPFLLAAAVGFGGIQAALAVMNAELDKLDKLVAPPIITDLAQQSQVASDNLLRLKNRLVALEQQKGEKKGFTTQLVREIEAVEKQIGAAELLVAQLRGLERQSGATAESLDELSVSTANAFGANAAEMISVRAANLESLATLEMEGIQDRLAFQEEMNNLSVELDFIASQQRIEIRQNEFEQEQSILDERIAANARFEEIERNRIGKFFKDEKKQGKAKLELQKRFASESLNALTSFGEAFQAITGKQSRALIAMEKAAAVVRIVIDTQIAAQKALAVAGPFGGFPLAALIVATGAARAATVIAADGGLTNVPEEQTMIQVRGGERVLSPNQNRDFTQFLDRSSPGTEVSGGGDSGGTGGNVQIDNFELVLFPDASPTEVMLNMSQEDWIEVTNEKIVPALIDLNRAGLTAST